jgi:hypothetical protein
MKLTQDLVVCALKRAMRPITAAEALAYAQELAPRADWPTRSIAEWTVKQAAALLVHATKERRAVQELRDATDVMYWRPIDGYDPDAEIPDPPEGKAEQHPLDGMSRAQVLAVFDITTDCLAETTAMLSTALEGNRALAQRMVDLQRTASRRLAAVGLDGLP